MSQPRRIVPGSFYMVTRRTVQRMFLLRPEKEISEIFEYCLAEAAARFDIRIISWLVMSNHYHAIVYDPGTKLPAFLEHFHKMVAKAVNGHRERWENFWSTEETCVTRLVTLDDVFDKVVYTLMNPVSGHLVDKVAQWPGSSSWARMGKASKTVRRPRVYFRKGGVMPAEVELQVVAPPGLKRESYAAWIGRVRAEVHRREGEACTERREGHIKLVGRRAVLATDPFGAPSTDAPRRRLRPALACKDKQRMKEERAILKGFRCSYREMFANFVEQNRQRNADGDTNVVQKSSAKSRKKPPTRKRTIEFPAGTYRFRILGVRCAPFADAA